MTWSRGALCVLLISAACSLSCRARANADEWEGVVPFEPRPIVLRINLHSGEASADIRPGSPLHLSELRVEGMHAHFALTLAGSGLHFDTVEEGDELRGEVTRNGFKAPFVLTRLPSFPHPHDRIEAWQQDLAVLLSRFVQYDRSFSPEAREQFRQQVADLRRKLHNESDDEVRVGIMRAIALSNNAHTLLYPESMRPSVPFLPLRLWWFPDGLRVVQAASDLRRVLGCRVLEIEGRAVSSVKRQVDELFAGNDQRHRHLDPRYMMRADVLHGLGIAKDPEHISLKLSDCTSAAVVVLSPTPKGPQSAGEAWRDLAPASSGGYMAERGAASPTEAFASVLTPERAPLYLQYAGRGYLFKILPRRNAIYFQYNRSLNDSAAEPFDTFARQLIQTMDALPQAALIVDLRNNTGGNLEIAEEYMLKLQAHARYRRVYVIIGRATFSAGLYHAAQWKQWGHAKFVGEEPGDALDFWAEGGNLVLPNSGLQPRYSNGFHCYSGRHYPPDFGPYFRQLSVGNLMPDIPVILSWEQYSRGDDPALDAVTSDLLGAHHERGRGASWPRVQD